MAKSKDSDEVIKPFIAPTVGVTVPPTVDPKDAEIERLKAELEAAKAAASQASAAEPVTFDGPKRKYLVEVPHGPRWVVEAAHEAIATSEYLKATGMTSWVAAPSIREVDDSVPLGEYKG